MVARDHALARSRMAQRAVHANIRSMTAQPGAHVRFKRAIERRALWLAEDAARELPTLSLELVHLYAEKESPKFERAALRWLERYLSEGVPSLELFARTVASLAALELGRGALASASARLRASGSGER